jgi:hypothetical protein
MRCDRKMSAMIFSDAQKLESAASLVWNRRSSDKGERGGAPVRVSQPNLLLASTTRLRLLRAVVSRSAARITPGCKALASAAP